MTKNGINMENIQKAPIIGARLRKYVTDNRIFQANWARAQGIDARTVARYFKRKDMRIGTLFTISQVLKHNFIREIADQLPVEFPPHAVNPLQQELDALKKENEDLKKEVAVLNRVVGVKS